MKFAWLIAFMAFCAVLVGGCSGGDSQAKSYVEPANFDYTVTLGGSFECGGWSHGTYQVEVRNHQAVSFAAVSEDDQWQIDNLGVQLEDIPTLADIVASFLKAKSRGADIVSYTWDDATGYPVSLCVDPDAVDTIDDEWGFEVSEVVVLDG
jgi:hypothetical protein